MPWRRQCASSAAWSSPSMVQPVGLFGELTMTTRVSGVSAAMSLSMSRRQASRWKSRAMVSTFAPTILGISTRFGHSGVTTTTRSPGPTRACTASISADMPDVVAAILDAGVAQFGDAEILRIKRIAAFDRSDAGVADELRRDFVWLAKPERQHVGQADT